MIDTTKRNDKSGNMQKISDELDNYGILTEHIPDNATQYDFGLIREYCQKNNKTLAEMTESEIEQFVIE